MLLCVSYMLEMAVGQIMRFTYSPVLLVGRWGIRMGWQCLEGSSWNTLSIEHSRVIWPSPLVEAQGQPRVLSLLFPPYPFKMSRASASNSQIVLVGMECRGLQLCLALSCCYRGKVQAKLCNRSISVSHI